MTILPVAIILVALSSPTARASSFENFAGVYAQVTSNMTSLELGFDPANPAARHARAVLVAARDAMLDPGLSDEQVLARLISVFGAEAGYAAWLDAAAFSVRASALGHYAALGERVRMLPPSRPATRVQSRFAALAQDLAALNGAPHAVEISGQLVPFGKKVDAVLKLIRGALVMPQPRVNANAVRATVNGHRFASAGVGAHSPNTFVVTAPDPLYHSVYARVVDVGQVLTFTLPVVTSQPRCDLAAGLATVNYVADIFATNATTLTATNGTFWVQGTMDQLYGVFSCSGPGLEIKDGRFRIQLPRAPR